MSKETHQPKSQTDAVLPAEENSPVTMGEVEQFIHRFKPDADQFLEIEPILHQMVEQLQKTFAFYHAQIYLSNQVDLPLVRAEIGQEPRLILVAGSGAIGKQRLAKEFSLPLSGRRSLIARAGREQTMIVAEDTDQVEHHLPHILLPHTRSEITIPLTVGERLLGVLDIQQDRPQAFSPETRLGLRFIAHHLTQIIQQAEQSRQQVRWRHQLDSLRRLLHEAVQQTNRDQLIEKATDFLGHALSADNYGFWFVDEQSGNLRSHSSYRHIVGQRTPTLCGPGEGFVGQVFATGQSRLVGDVSEEPVYERDRHIRAIMCVPVWQDEGKQVIGVICAESQHPYAFREMDEALLAAVAAQVASMLEKIGLEQRLQQVEQERHTLLNSVHATVRERTHILTRIATEARNVVNGDICHVHLLEPDGETLRCAVCLDDADLVSQNQMHLHLGQGIIGSVALSGAPEVIENSRFDRRALYLLPNDTPPVTALVVPLTLRQQVLGTLAVLRLDATPPFTEADIPLLVAIAEQAALAVENERLFQAEQDKQMEYELINAIAEIGLSAIDEDDLLAQATAMIADHLHLSNFGVLLLNQTRSQLAPHTSYRGAQTAIPLAASLVGRVITTGTPLYLANISLDSSPHRTNPDTHSLFCLPLQAENEIVGIVNAESAQKNAFDPKTQRLLRTCTQQLSVALERVRSHATVRHQIPQQRILTDHIIEILSASTAQRLSQAIHDAVDDILNVDRSALYLYGADQEELVPMYTRGISDKYVRSLNDQLPDTPAYRLLYAQRPIVINDVYQNPETSHLSHLLEREGIYSYALFPLDAPRNTPGILGVYRDNSSAFTATEQAIGEMLARVVSVALQQMQMWMEKRHAASRKQKRLELWEQAQQAQDLPTLLSTLIHRSVDLLEADAGLLGLQLSKQMLSYYPRNIPPQMSLPSTPQRKSVLWEVIKTGETISLTDYGRYSRAQASWKEANVHTFLGIPLHHEGKSLGVLAFFHLNAHKQFTIQDHQVAESLGRLASSTIYTLRHRQSLQERISEFSQALQRQTELDQQKDVFIHGMSHELRTPLGIILGHAELLENEMLGPLSQAQQDSIQIIARRTRMINKLVDDLSVLLAAQTQEFQRETLKPAQLLHGMLADFQLQAEEKDVNLTAAIAPDLPSIKGDPIHLRRVFDNLLSNALKFTPPGGSISLQAETIRNNVVFAVTDTGKGMPPDQLNRIFERFYQVRSQKGHPGGTGLGLALVREIVEAHRGQVRVESEEGEGSMFEVRLPAHTP